MVHQWESGGSFTVAEGIRSLQDPVSGLEMGHEFTKDPKTRGTEAVITLSRQVIEVSGREQVVIFEVRDRNPFHKHLGLSKDDDVIYPPTRTRPIRLATVKQRMQLCIIQLSDV